jgi:hypothetical protein
MPRDRILSSLFALCSLAALAAAGAPRAGADWLVTRQGARVETRGPWQEKGKLVVFSRPDGTLASLRLADVDLAASRKATREEADVKAQPPKEPVKPQKRESIAKLSDKDFQRTAPKPENEAEKEAEKEEKPGADSAKKPGSVAVASWERGKSPDDGHVVVNGTIRNAATDQATAAGVTIRLFDETGTLVGQGEAVLTSTVIPGGGTVGFQADFPDLFTFAAAKFETHSLNLGKGPAQPSAIPINQK